MSEQLPPEQDRFAQGLIGRSARLLNIPLSEAGRRAAGWGKRLAGADKAQVQEHNAERAAEQLFQVLGELKGGAMKFGQIMSMLEAALPEEHAAPLRQHLRRLQDSAPPMPASKVQTVLRGDLGEDWRDLFTEFAMRPHAAASIGQVHKAVWAATGEIVAVKIQYPGAEQALMTDLSTVRRLAKAMSPLTGGIDVVSWTEEMSQRMSEEVDYVREGAAQEQVAQSCDGHAEFVVPHVRHATTRVLVSQWIDGERLSAWDTQPEEERNRVGLLYARFLFAAPHISGILHADPHPGNFLVCPDGRLAALDFGLVARVPEGLPPAMGSLLRFACDHDAEAVAKGLSDEGFVTDDIDPRELLSYLAPFVEPAAVEEFHFTREWMREQFVRVSDINGNDRIAFKLTVPAVYALIYRVWLGGIAVLAQLDVRARFRDILAEFLPGWDSEGR